MKSSDGSWSNPLCYVEHIRALQLTHFVDVFRADAGLLHHT